MVVERRAVRAARFPHQNSNLNLSVCGVEISVAQKGEKTQKKSENMAQYNLVTPLAGMQIALEPCGKFLSDANFAAVRATLGEQDSRKGAGSALKPT